MKSFNIVFTIDENYIKYFCVACTSLLENNRKVSKIFLIHDISKNSYLNKTITFLNQKYGIEIQELSLESKILDNLKISHHISKATYFRLLLAEILPSDIDEVLFLDSDIIVNGDLSELWKEGFMKKDKLSLHN